MKILKRIPMFGFMLIIVNFFILIGKNMFLDRSPFINIDAISKAGQWHMTYGDILVVIGLIFLFIEVLKSTRTSKAAIFDHIFSTLIFIIFLIEFILFKTARTSPFLILTLMSLFDVIAGFSVTITTARRDVTMDRDSGFIPPAQH